MSDSGARRSFDTVVIPATLVFPDDLMPDMRHDTVRIPVKVVWRSADPQTPEAAVAPSPTPYRTTPLTPRAAENPGADDPAPDLAATAEPEPSQPSDRSPADPVASFLKINETLDRIARPAAPQSPDGAAGGTGEKDVPDPTAPVPVVDDNGVPIQGARGANDAPGQSSAAVLRREMTR
jgi:hypothetical protein